MLITFRLSERVLLNKNFHFTVSKTIKIVDKLSRSLYLYCIIFAAIQTMKELTKAEEQIMHILWELKSGMVNDILALMPEPKPAYNTVSTIIRILEKKGFVGHKAWGRTHEYFPLVVKEDYTREYLGNIVKAYFSNSYQHLVSFFTKENNLTVNEMEEIKEVIESEISKQKSGEQ